jgi:hypothetical protein
LLLLGVQAVIYSVVMARYGLLALFSFFVTLSLLHAAPVTLNLDAWYAWQGLLVVLVLATLALWATRVATAGQKLFGDGFLAYD